MSLGLNHVMIILNPIILSPFLNVFFILGGPKGTHKKTSENGLTTNDAIWGLRALVIPNYMQWLQITIDAGAEICTR